ncbi:hypothetical protein [Paraburkholderia sp. RL17-337-BIB-A]|uniref:hypothetical protein n=1 Tax=Paraburkholderia sp. RL17-337-BIB-A TaxID=3031636 RepID=UPI0038BC2575
MAFSVTPYPSDIKGLGRKVRVALGQLGEPVPEGSRLSLLEPIPVYSGRSARLGNSLTKFVHPSGRRAIVLDDGRPIALLDLPANPEHSSKPLSIRGHDAARALFSALREAEQLPNRENTELEVRFVIFHSLSVTALWLMSEHSVFIPTRVGSADRPKPMTFSEPDFIKLLRRCRQRLRRHKSTSGAVNR